MAEPVIVDDGGSTRIRQIGNRKHLDKLLTELKDDANGTWGDVPHLKVLYIGPDGVMQELIGGQLARKDLVTIASSNAQHIDIKVKDVLFGRVDLEVEVGSTGEAPILEARQYKDKQRRYVIVNAGSIKTVSINGAAPLFDSAVQTSLYTLLMFGDPDHS